MQAALVAIENGTQAALMAPTEILATQHYLSARKLLGGAISPSTGKPYRVALLTGSLDDRTKRETQGRVMRGDVQFVIGTHALQENKADFANLGLVIVDEQHRFGVQQRFKLMKKPGADGRITEPDVLSMTATPIPRTLALTLYGDLDVSVIDEMPPGRTPIVTRRTSEERAAEVWDFVRKQVAQGRQAYLVYPVIEGSKDDQPELDFPHDPDDPEPDLAQPGQHGLQEPAWQRKAPTARRHTRLGRRPGLASMKNSRAEGPGRKPRPTSAAPLIQHPPPNLVNPPKLFAEKTKLRSATEMYDELRSGALNGLRLGLLHGRLSADDKEVTMAQFKRGDIDVLIAVPPLSRSGVRRGYFASVMVVDHASSALNWRRCTRLRGLRRWPRRREELLHSDDRGLSHQSRQMRA